MRWYGMYEKLWKHMKSNQNRRRTAGVPLFFMVFHIIFVVFHGIPKPVHCFPWYFEDFSSFFIIFHNIPKHFHRFSCAPWYMYSNAFSLCFIIFQSIPKHFHRFSRYSIVFLNIFIAFHNIQPYSNAFSLCFIVFPCIPKHSHRF